MKHTPLIFAFALACGSPSSSDDEVGESEGSDDSTSSGESESGSEDESGSETGEDPPGYDEPGPHAVGSSMFVLADPVGDRHLRVQIWYPSEEAGGDPIEGFEPDEPNASTFAGLVASAEAPCVRTQTSTRFGALPAGAGPWPTLLFSHCHTCTRFSSYSIAERLASHGFMVVAPDHAGNTLFDALEGEPLPVNAATLELRFADMTRVLDELLDPAAASLPAHFVGLADPTRLGMFGHSFGSVTTGRMLQDDDRLSAGVGIAAPFESPLLPGITMAAIAEPVLLLVATEDNSITEIGNDIIRSNFGTANTPAWKIEFVDAGHWSFSDICNLVEGFQPGCGEGQRQTDPAQSFSYLDNDIARGLTATRVTAFFALHLLGDEAGRALLEADDPVLDIDVRE